MYLLKKSISISRERIKWIVNPSGTPIVEVRKLSHSYLIGTELRVDSLREVDFRVFPEETVGLIGPAGSGKSTLLHHLNGLIRPSSGEVWVLGVSLSQIGGRIPMIRTRIGLLFQNPENQLFEQFVGDDVAFGPRNMGLSPEEVRRRVRAAMGLVDLPFSQKDRQIATLSLGEKRRAALAGVLALEPELLVLDEPTASLDPEGRKRLLSTLREWRSVEGRALVIASHNMDDIVEMADRVYVLIRGRVALSGTTRDVFTKADFLLGNGLGVPAATALMHDLSNRGYGVSLSALSDLEAVEEIGRLQRG
jgi:energy-coupling factor transporter ATPase